MYNIDKIFDLMRQNNLTAKELGNELDISSSSFTGWKKGRRNPSGTMIIKIADYFNVPIDYFLADEFKNNEIKEIINSETQQNAKSFLELYNSLTELGFISNDEELTDKKIKVIIEYLKNNKNVIDKLSKD